MADYRILSVGDHDSQLCVEVEHFNADGTHWFFEEYHWQGREGLKRKRQTDAQGRPLMDNGQPVPLIPDPDTGDMIPVLPSGREYALGNTPHMVDDSIFTTIESIHRNRGTNQGYDGRRLSLSLSATLEDHAGIGQLVAKFASLNGRERP